MRFTKLYLKGGNTAEGDFELRDVSTGTGRVPMFIGTQDNPGVRISDRLPLARYLALPVASVAYAIPAEEDPDAVLVVLVRGGSVEEVFRSSGGPLGIRVIVADADIEGREEEGIHSVSEDRVVLFEHEVAFDDERVGAVMDGLMS